MRRAGVPAARRTVVGVSIPRGARRAARNGALRRWAIVVVGAVLIVAAPTLAGGVAGSVSRADTARPAPAELLRRALRSATVPHQGLVESRGSLGLPDVRRFGDVAALLGSTTRARVWWSSPDSWRVARLLTTGEQDLYGTGGGALVSWDYERNVRRTTIGADNVRLPRVDDLLPPQAARRLLSALAPTDPVTAGPSRRIAGIQAAGLHVVRGSPDSTVGALDVWVDPGSGLPLAVAVRDRAGLTALETSFLDVDLRRPTAADVAPPVPEGARVEIGDAPDLVSLVDRYSGQRFPWALAGRRRAVGVLHGTATYGSGLARFVVVPLPPGTADDVLDAMRLRTKVEEVPGGQVGVIDSGIVTAGVAVGSSAQGSYLLAGLVTRDLLTTAAKDLLTGSDTVVSR
jgi:hypothetical protein